MIDLIGKKNIFLGIAGFLIVASIVLVGAFGLKQGIDLKGGTLWSVDITKKDRAVLVEEVTKTLEAAGAENVIVREEGKGTFMVRLGSMTEGEHEKYKQALEESLGKVEEKSFSNIGPIIGKELKTQAIWAIVMVILGISIYIAWAFRKASERVKSWKYGVVTLITLLHDVIIPTGLLAYLGHTRGIELDTNFIVALLVVMGFSVHDTIVVFDRVRENTMRERGRKTSFAEIINMSVNETFARSVNTTLTLVLVLVALLFFGPQVLFYFILTILVGTVVGTYSSIFVASPLLYLWAEKSKK